MSSPIMRHPDDANLMSFAAGTLPEPLAAAIVAHAELCPRCRKELAGLSVLGGALLASDPPLEISSADRSASAARNDAVFSQAWQLTPLEARKAAGNTPEMARPRLALGLPPAIAAKYQIDLETLSWRWLAPGIRHFPLALSAGVTGDLRLLKIGPGRKMPEHSHGGSEMTLVLDGAFHDATGDYNRGDIQDADDELQHQPITCPERGCVCLVASEHPARFKGVVSRLLQPWTGM
jgi:putative transcriptional regulator